MRDTLQFGIFVAVLIAFVFVGCLERGLRKRHLKLTRRRNKPRDEARRIAANMAKLPDIIKRPTGATNEATLAICERVAEVQALLHDHVECG